VPEVYISILFSSPITFVYSKIMLSFKRKLILKILLVDSPYFRAFQATRTSGKQASGFLIPLKLPLVPCSSNNCKFTTMRLTVSTTMSYVHVGNINCIMVDSFEAINTIVVCDIAFTTEQVQYRSMNF